MNDYTRLIKFPDGWKMKSLEREYEEYERGEDDLVYVTWWEGQVEGPNELVISVTGETKEEVLDGLIKAVNNERHIH